MKSRLQINIPFVTAYDDPPAAGAGDGTGAGAGAGAGGGNPPPPATFTQEQVNSIVKKEADKAKAERQKLIQQLETIQNDAKTTAETKAQLEAQLEELRTANMSAEQKAALERDKLTKAHTTELTAAKTEAQTWRGRHDDLQIGYEITTEATKAEMLPQSLPFVEAFIKPRTKLVDVLDDDNKPTGRFTPKVTMQIVDGKGNPATVEYTVAEAMKYMKETPEQYGHLFKTNAAAGLGAGTGTPGKKPNIANMSPAQYMEARKKNPASVGL